MHSAATVGAALSMAAEGLSPSEVARRLDVPRSTVRDWLAGALPRTAASNNGWSEAEELNGLPEAYVHVLGLYLGDGCISSAPRAYKLRVFLDRKYPRIIAGARASILAVHRSSVGVARHRRNCVEVYSYWRYWPRLFPQHGPGKKHERTIALTGWQQSLVARWPEQLLRGLIESDGYRFHNTGRDGWTAARYGFKQFSGDIRRIFCDACDRVGVRWTESGGNTIYVSRKADVALLDTFIGPKR